MMRCVVCLVLLHAAVRPLSPLYLSCVPAYCLHAIVPIEVASFGGVICMLIPIVHAAAAAAVCGRGCAAA